MNNLKKMRKNKKLTQTDVAQLLKISRQSVAFYEDGTRNPKPETWQKLADFYGVSVPYLQGAYSKEEIIDIYDSFMKKVIEFLTKGVKIISQTKYYSLTKLLDKLNLLLSTNKEACELMGSILMNEEQRNLTVDNKDFSTIAEIYLLNKDYIELDFTYFKMLNEKDDKDLNKSSKRIEQRYGVLIDHVPTDKDIINLKNKTLDLSKKIIKVYSSIQLKIPKKNYLFLFNNRSIKWLLKYPNIEVENNEIEEIIENIVQKKFNILLLITGYTTLDGFYFNSLTP